MPDDCPGDALTRRYRWVSAVRPDSPKPSGAVVPAFDTSTADVKICVPVVKVPGRGSQGLVQAWSTPPTGRAPRPQLAPGP